MNSALQPPIEIDPATLHALAVLADDMTRRAALVSLADLPEDRRP